MNNHLIVLGIAVLLLAVGLSGCYKDDTTLENDNGKEGITEAIFELEKIDLFYTFEYDTWTENSWMEFEIKNIGKINTSDINLYFKIENLEGHQIIYKSTSTLEMIPQEIFKGKFTLGIDWIRNSYAPEPLNGKTSIYYDKGTEEITFRLVKQVETYNSSTVNPSPMYSLE